MTKPAEPKTVAMRLPPKLLEQVEKFREKLAKERPGQRVTASDAMRVLMERGLQA
jgi:hypothetical protein